MVREMGGLGLLQPAGLEQGFSGAYTTGAEAREAAEKWTGTLKR